MRVLMIAPEPFFQSRGTPISILHRLRALSKLSHHVDLLTYPMGFDPDIEGVKIHRIPNLPLLKEIKVGPSYVKPILDLLLLFKTIYFLTRNRYDLIHTHEEAAYFSAFLAKIFKTKLLYDMHSSLPQQLINYGFSCWKPIIWVFSLMEKLVIREAQAIITICPDLRDHVERIVQDGKQFMIENFAAEVPVYSADESEMASLRAQFRLDGKAVVLYVGTFEKNQGLDLLVRSAPVVTANFSEVVFLLVGGTEEQIKDLKRLASEVGVADFFSFSTRLPIGQIPNFLAVADILVSPRSEGTNTPLKIYSYLRAGKPIVATDLPTHRQVLDEDLAIMVEPEPSNLAWGILTLLENEELRRTFGERCRAFVDENYSDQVFVEKVKEVYDYLRKSP